MLWGSKFVKFRLRDKWLNSISWCGDEKVLDIGCGHGLMLIGAAKRLRDGKAIGIDLWQ
jgi:cyclopropane fatty-acyl-phospholipid synthase-like methyltransferase